MGYNEADVVRLARSKLELFVHRINYVIIFLINDLTFHFQSWCQFSGFNGKIIGKDTEIFDCFVSGQILIHFINISLDFVEDDFTLNSLLRTQSINT